MDDARKVKAKLCRVHSCTSYARARGLCSAHGAMGFCSVEGCATAAHSKGLCRKHGTVKNPKPLCRMPGCKTLSQKDMLCRKHGAYGVCKTRTCFSMAVNSTGLCNKHGARGFCSVDGCATAAHPSSKGLCGKHGGGTKQPCSMPGCKSLSMKDMLCRKHGAYGVCTAPTLSLIHI